MAVVKSVTGALVMLVIVVAVVGVGLGLASSDTDILNPRTSTARELQMAEQTRHQAAMNVLQERKVADELRLELDQRRRQSELDLQLRLTRGRVAAIAAGLALVILAIGVAALLAGFGRRWAVVPTQSPAGSSARNENLWENRTFRVAMIQLARQRERSTRQGQSDELILEHVPYWARSAPAEEPNARYDVNPYERLVSPV